MLGIASLYGWNSVTIRVGYRHHPVFIFINSFLFYLFSVT